jgi:Lar family restriction alleviation protein
MISYDGERQYELLPCPFCGGEPIVRFIGNDHSRKRVIEIRCKKCRASRKDAALRYGFDWLESIATEAWNTRSERCP